MERIKVPGKSWLQSLENLLSELDQQAPSFRAAFVGIGNSLLGDDGSGPAVIERLEEDTSQDRFLFVNGGPAPENCTGKLRGFGPDLVVFIDSALMNSEPGTIQCLDWEKTDGISASTHSLPLHIVVDYLVKELDCEVLFIGIEPKINHLREKLTPSVGQAVDEIVSGIQDCIQRYNP